MASGLAAAAVWAWCCQKLWPAAPTALAGLPAAASPAAVGFNAAALQRLRAYLDQQVAAGRVAGLQLAVLRHGQVALVHGAGCQNAEEGVPVSADTLYRIYSMTKPITSCAVLLLAERGLLHLDDPVAKHLPCFQDMRVVTGREADGTFTTAPAAHPITIQQLLTHTAGLSYWWAIYALPAAACPAPGLESCFDSRAAPLCMPRFVPDDAGVHELYSQAKVAFAFITQADHDGA
jgi:CubicO group peptidase (beta-lactamase class C family)